MQQAFENKLLFERITCLCNQKIDAKILMTVSRDLFTLIDGNIAQQYTQKILTES